MKNFTIRLSLKRIVTFLFILAGAGLYAQNVPEMMYYKFDVPGATVQNYASSPVGTNPAPVTGLTQGPAAGQFGLALVGQNGSSTTYRVNTGWATSLPSTGWTISMWLNNQPVNTNLYYLWGDPGAASFRCFIGGAAGSGNILLRGGGLTDVNVPGVGPGPTVVTFVYTGTTGTPPNRIRYFKNGVYINQVTEPTVTVSGAGPFLVGGYDGNVGMYTNALMDEFRMYNRPLSDAEVGLTWNAQLPMCTGTLSGTVRSSYNLAVLPGVSVTVGTMPPVLTNASGVYTVAGLSAGNVTVTATLAGYTPFSGSSTVTCNITTTYNFNMSPIPATLSGVVTNAANNAPIKGAKVVWSGNVTYSVAGGLYTLNVYPFAGSFPVTFTKAGFADTTTTAITLVSGVNPPLNMAMLEAKNPASQPFTAALNGSATVVNLNWGLPVGNYEIIYDDGIQELSTVWATKDNQNAEKFTPLAYPVTVIGGSVNIGPAGDYPVGAVPSSLTPFTVQVYDATGAAGTPGAALGTPVTVTPTSFGWNTFTITGVSITSGNFFIVMTQAGAPPVAARLGQDTSSTQLRAYSKYVTGGGSWLPANGNFMIRAVVQGVGGPIDSPEGTTGYQVYRLFQTQETNPGSWTSIAAPTTNSAVDPGWPSLPDSAYRWAVKAHYWLNRWSTPIFSNVLGKNRTANVVVNVAPSCAVSSLAGSLVTLTCTSPGVDSVYSMLTDAAGTATFPHVWKGAYLLTVTRDGYSVYSANVSIFGDHTYNVTILVVKASPSKPIVDNTSLLVTWSPPGVSSYGLDENFTNFTTNGWSTSSYWAINAAFGNPAPCAELPWTLMLVNYDNVNLVSKSLAGYGASDYKLSYDIYLNNFSATGAEQMEVELQVNGAGPWIGLAHYANTASIPWTSVTIDLAAYTNSTIKVRFRAHGADMFNFNYWDVDNVKVGVPHPGFDPRPCILGYNVFLNSTVLIGSTPDTTFTIPGSLIVYGNTYTACVEAIYSSGTSARPCSDPFTSRWLCPPTELTGQAVQSDAFLEWKKPNCVGCTPTPYIYDDGSYEMNWWIGAGATGMLGNKFTLAGTVTGTLTDESVWFVTATTPTPVTYRVYDASYNLLYETPPFTPVPDSWNTIPLNNTPFTGTFFGMVSWVGNNTTATVGLDLYGSPNNAWGYYIPLGGWFSLYTWGGYTGSYMVRINACVNGKNSGLLLPDNTPTASLPPNVTVPFVGINNVSTTVADPVNPNAPLAVPPLLLGYNVYRNDIHVGANPTISNPNTLHYEDLALNPGVYEYTVTGWYNVAPIAPLVANSAPAGPVEVVINYGRPLPFNEPWDMGTFSFNSWYHTPGDNWSISAGFGNPAPCADFSFDTPSPLTNYSDTLRSTTFTAAPYTCAKIYLDFDYKLLDRNNTGDEYLIAEELVDGAWKKVVEFANNGDVNWSTQHFELKQTIGKAFKIQFRAHGVNSLDILHWYVDNIHIYAVCTPPTDLSYTEQQNIVHLTWTAPECVSESPFTIIWDDGTYEAGYTSGGGERHYGNMFPLTPGSSGYLTSFDVMFNNMDGTAFPIDVIMDVFDETHNLLGSSAPFTQQLDVFQNIPVPSIPFSGTFYGMIYMNNTGTRPYYNSLDTDGPNAYLDYGTREQAGVWQTIGSYGGIPGVFLVRANGMMAGKDKKSFSIMPGQNPNSKPNLNGVKNSSEMVIGNGDSHSHPGIGLLIPKTASSGSLQGYNVYRTDSTGLIPYYKLNTTGPVTATAYTDVIPLAAYGPYKYYVTDVFNDTITNILLCESSSDTISLLYPVVGINDLTNSSLSLYPNPANDVVNIVSTNDIKTIEVLNYIGQMIYTNKNVSLKKVELNVSSFKAGVYFVKITTTSGIKTTKITVTH